MQFIMSHVVCQPYLLAYSCMLGFLDIGEEVSVAIVSIGFASDRSFLGGRDSCGGFSYGAILLADLKEILAATLCRE